MGRKKPTSGKPELPVDRILAAIDEWLNAFEAESSALVRAELQKVSANDTPEVILDRIESALRFLDDDARRLHERGEQERDEAKSLERRAIEAIRAGDDQAARDALAQQNDHLDRATKLFDEALQLKWLLNQYRSAAAAMQGREPEDD